MMDETTSYDPTPTPSEAPGLVGLAPADSPSAQVGLPELTPEQIETLHTALLEKQKLGHYSDADLLEAEGKKIIVDKGNANVGLDAETGAALIRASSGNWLSAGHKDYDAALAEATAHGAPPAAAEKTPEQEERREIIQDIKAMVAIDAGSSAPHDFMDQAALQRIRAGASTMELKTLKPIVAAVDNFAHSGAADVNPEMLGHMHPPTLSGAGVDRAMEAVKARKEKENAMFTEQMRRKTKGEG